MWWIPEDTHFSRSYKDQINALIAERFKVSTAIESPSGCSEAEARKVRLRRAEELFYLCYHFVDNLSPRPLTFNAQYGLFRCLFGLFGLLGTISAVGIVVALFTRPERAGSFLMAAVIFGMCCWLSYERCKKRSEDFAQSVYDIFVAGVAMKRAS